MKKRIAPKPGQESVWDYPRPPRLEKITKHLKVIFKGHTIAETNRAYRILETSHPPVYYFPPEDIQMGLMQKKAGQMTFCEFKGSAEYWNIITNQGQSLSAAWSYPNRTLDILKSKITSPFMPARWMHVM